MVISEMFAASNGLGFTIVQFQRNFAIPDMWTGILLLGLLGFVLSVLFRLLERRALGWYHGLRDTSRRSS
jgi:ABC-type nitrate/sulfonate/bicarbonate transport system permease component